MSASFYGPVRKISLEPRLKRILISFNLQDTTLSHKLQAFGHRQITQCWNGPKFDRHGYLQAGHIFKCRAWAFEYWKNMYVNSSKWAY